MDTKETLKQWRSDNNITQVALSVTMGVHKRTIQRYESGCSIPPLRRMRDLEKITNGFVTVQEWVEDMR